MARSSRRENRKDNRRYQETRYQWSLGRETGAKTCQTAHGRLQKRVKQAEGVMKRVKRVGGDPDQVALPQFTMEDLAQLIRQCLLNARASAYSFPWLLQDIGSRFIVQKRGGFATCRLGTIAAKITQNELGCPDYVWQRFRSGEDAKPVSLPQYFGPDTNRMRAHTLFTPIACKRSTLAIS